MNNKFSAHLQSCVDDSSSDEDSICELIIKKQKLNIQSDETILNSDRMELIDDGFDEGHCLSEADLDEWVDEDQIIDFTKVKRHYVLPDKEEEVQVLDLKNKEFHEIMKEGNVRKKTIIDMIQWYKKHHPGNEKQIVLIKHSAKQSTIRSS